MVAPPRRAAARSTPFRQVGSAVADSEEISFADLTQIRHKPARNSAKRRSRLKHGILAQWPFPAKPPCIGRGALLVLGGGHLAWPREGSRR